MVHSRRAYWLSAVGLTLLLGVTPAARAGEPAPEDEPAPSEKPSTPVDETPANGDDATPPVVDPAATPRVFGSPDAVQNRIEADSRVSGATFDLDLFRPYQDWKDRLREETGYAFGLAHISMLVAASDTLPGADSFAASGVFRHFGSWELLGRGTETTGTLNYLVEHRHAYETATPSEFALANLGYAGFTGIPFGRDGWHLTNLYWAQSWLDGRIEVFAGFLDITDFVDVYALTSPWTDFYNFVFSIGAGTMDLPDDGALGAAAGAYLTDNLYLIAGFEDLNSDPNNPLDGFDTFFSDREWFKHVEFGWAGSQEMYYLDNIHLTLWHADEREEGGLEDGWGAMLSFSKSIDDHWLVFARGGFAEDGAGLLSRSVSVGFGYQPTPSWDGAGDVVAVGLNWGRPNEDLFGVDLDDQFSVEAYYRWQVTTRIAVTPDVQLLVNPALNTEHETLWVFGLRARIAF